MPRQPAMTGDSVYRQLQRRIDELPVPYPETESGVELRLLRALFTEEEARLALSLSAITEPVDVVAGRVPELPKSKVARHLASLAKKGAINMGVTRVGEKRIPTFGLAPLVVGMFEYQVDKLTPEFVHDFHEYLDEKFRSNVVGTTAGQMRTVPIRAEITADRRVAPYNNIRSWIGNHPGPFSVINCVCRQSAELIGEACTTSPSHETCLMIGHVPQHARELNHEEILQIMDRAEREGHVLQPQNSQNPSFICCCCPDCCEILTNARKLPRPADAIPNAYLAKVDASACTGCRKCVRRCPMEAISIVERRARVDESRCIGCGLCATTCPENAITLVSRRGRKRTPKNSRWMYLRMYAQRRGILGLIPLLLRKISGRPL